MLERLKKRTRKKIYKRRESVSVTDGGRVVCTHPYTLGHGVVYLFHGTSVDMRRRRYDDGDGRGVEETKIGPRLIERAGYQK